MVIAAPGPAGGIAAWDCLAEDQVATGAIRIGAIIYR
jgi:hypothetical protein